MARWEPNARARLEEAAMALFLERGYDRTTVDDIAERAGLTERTFFRYYTDKREVLFGGSAALRELMVDAIAAAPEAAAPLDAVAAALDAAASALEPRRKHARARRKVIVGHAELREREQMKLTSLAAAMASALCARGVVESTASLTAEAGIVVFKVGFERWVDDARQHTLSQHIAAALDELRAVMTAPRTRPSRRRSPRPRRASRDGRGAT
jgi:AcrR family transcriptional regulator